MHRQSNPALSHLTAHVRARAASSSAKVSPLGKWARQPALSDTVFKPAAASSSRSPSHSVPSDTPPAPASKWARKESESGSLWGSRPSSNFRSRTPEHATRPPARHHDIRHPSSNRPTKTSQLANKKKGIATPQASSSRDAVFDRESTSHPNKRSKDKKEQSKEGLVPTMDRGTPGEGSEIRNTERDVEEDELAEDRSSFSPRSDSVFDSDGNRNRKRGNLVFKQRGSLLSSHAAPANHDRGQEVTTDQKPKRLPKAKVMRLKVDLHIPSMVSVETLSRLLNITLSRLQRKMREQGMEDQMSPDYILTTEYAALLAEEFGRNAIVDDEAAFDLYPPPTATDLSTLHPRPPVVTIMGHVDHGKTTLLDTLRSASVAAGEAGGITQHIGAFSVKVPNASGSGPSVITFLDTPGHAAFSAMRARGARVTDIVVLVVAADDGVMPQTKEVIELVKKDDKVQLVVAINKTDKPGIDLDKVHNALLVEEIHVEPIGGDIPAVRVSGLTGQGLDELVETISAVSELQDLRAERDGLVHGYVLESKVQKGFGAVATVLVLRGCLKPGANIIAGTSTGRVRMMTDSTGKVVKAAYPGDAITVSGWKELPAAGDEVLQGSDRDIKRAVANRHRKADLEKMLQDVEVINEQRTKDRELRVAELLAEEKGEEIPRQEEEKGPKEVNILIKGDVSGSVEALTEVLQNIGNEVARAKVLDGEVGEVTSSDVLRAKTASAMIVAFSMPVPKSVQAEAASVGVTIYSSSVIYKVMDEVRARVTDLLPQQYAKKVTGEATVYQIFDIQLARKRVKKVAGCRITNGLVERNKQVQVVRNGEVVFEGRMDTFKHRKDDINEARKGSECGIAVEKFEDLQADDIIQAYNLEPLPKFL